MWHFMQTVSSWDNVHEMSNPVSWEKKREPFLKKFICWKLIVSTLDVFSRQYIDECLFFPINIWHLETICMACQILFSRKSMKMFKMSAETKFNIQHFEIFFLFSQKTKACFWLTCGLLRMSYCDQFSSVVRPSVRASVRQHFQTTSPLKPLSQICSNFIWSLLRLGERKKC